MSPDPLRRVSAPSRRTALLGLATACLGLGALAGCGFQPLYGGQNRQVRSLLSEIRVEPIANRAGQLLRNELVTGMTPQGIPAQPRYSLSVGLGANVVDLDIQRDATTTFATLILTGNYVLRETASGASVASGQAVSQVSFNILQTPYADRTSRENAERRAITALADDIQRRIAIQLNAGTSPG